MWDRTLTVSSCGKTFSCTGWKVGWIYGSAKLIQPIMLANQWIQFCVSSPTQKAFSDIITLSDQPYEGNTRTYLLTHLLTYSLTYSLTYLLSHMKVFLHIIHI